MNNPSKSAWSIIIILCLLGLEFFFAAKIVKADDIPLETRLARQAERFQSAKDQPVDTAELGCAIAGVTRSREWAAFLLTLAVHESGLAERIRVGDCRPHECDGGRAWGLWQNWRSQQNDAVWGSPDLAVQAKAAAHLGTQMFNMCRSAGVPFPLGTFRALGGRGCKHPLPGEDKRVATYQRILKGI